MEIASESSEIIDNKSSNIEVLDTDDPPEKMELTPKEVPDVSETETLANTELSSENVQESKVVDDENKGLKRKAEEIAVEASSVPVQNDLEAKILRQVDFYFGDSNFRRDKFLLEKTSQEQDRYLPIDILMTFKKLRELTEDATVVVKAIESSEVVELSECKTKLRRRHPLPEKDDSADRTVFVKGLGFDNKEMTIDLLKNLFRPYGEVGWCRLMFSEMSSETEETITKDDGWKVSAMSRKGRKAFSGSALVEYLTKEGCENALHAHPEYRGKILHVEKSHMSINDQKTSREKRIAPGDPYPKGLLLKASNLKPGTTWKKLKDAIKDKAAPEFVEVNEGENTALLQFGSSESTNKLLEACADGVEIEGQHITFSTLQEQEELQYWSKQPEFIVRKFLKSSPEGNSRKKAKVETPMEAYQEGKVLVVEGMPEVANWKDVKVKFQEKGAQVAFIQAEDGKILMRMKTLDDAKKVLDEPEKFQMDGASLTFTILTGEEEKTFYEQQHVKMSAAKSETAEGPQQEPGCIFKVVDVPAGTEWIKLKSVIESKGSSVGFIQVIEKDNVAFVRVKSKEDLENLFKECSEVQLGEAKLSIQRITEEEEKEYITANPRKPRGGFAGRRGGRHGGGRGGGRRGGYRGKGNRR